MKNSGTPHGPIPKWGNPYAQTIYPCDETWNSMSKKILHPFVIKLGTPHNPIAKWRNPYAQTIYPCDETWNPLCKKILHPFVTKSGTPHGSVAKWGNPYAQTIYPYAESWNPLCKKIVHPLMRKLGTLMALLLNEETLMPRQFTPVTKHRTLLQKNTTPIDDEIGNPSWPHC